MDYKLVVTRWNRACFEIVSIMKRLIFLIFLVCLAVSCGTSRKASPKDAGMVMTRKFVGNYIEYRQTPSARIGYPNLVWIKTTLKGTYGRISAYSKDCKFKAGDRLYIRKEYIMPGVSGYWEYYVESDDGSVLYKLTEFQNDKKVNTDSWFGKGSDSGE